MQPQTRLKDRLHFSHILKLTLLIYIQWTAVWKIQASRRQRNSLIHIPRHLGYTRTPLLV